MVHVLRSFVCSLVLFTTAFAVPALAEVEVVAADDQREEGQINIEPKGEGVYLVRMSDEPVVRYTGNIPGLKATRPAKGEKLDPNNPAVAKYVAHLEAKHDAAIAAAGGGQKLYDYRYSVNGFAAKLTTEQAARLRAVPGVVSVEKDQQIAPDTVSTPGMLKVAGPGGLWEQVGGIDKAGEDIVIGIVDSGVWPEHPSFSDRTGENNNGVDGKLDYRQLPGWNGKCVPGEDFNASLCNQKLIGCQTFNSTWLGFSPVPMVPGEFLSCRDSDGHGTHTATTAGGNSNVEVVPGLKMSGMAPRARVSAYKVCWDDGDPLTGGCYFGDIAAAVDQAVIDGVDVINMSIGGSTTQFANIVGVAFFNAADAGIFVATSAGNSGPTASTVAHAGPWLTTVAASNHDRTGAGDVILGGTTVPTRSGVNMAAGTGVAPLPLVHSSLVGVAVDPIADPSKEPTPFAERVALCFAGHLDPSKVVGKIVVCDRGITARVDKGAVVKAAGGVGMVLANRTAAENLVADVHSLPAIHVNDAPVAGVQTIRDYAKTPGATARIADGAVAALSPFAHTIASFSSRGPILAGKGDLLKPDVTAPGVDIIAGTSPAGANGALFESLQGTSMASPHVAGLAAVLKAQYPAWSPMMIKSALMTTAKDLSAPNVMNQGAGFVQPSLATNPGLVYDSNATDWIKFLCGTGELTGCAAADTIDPSDLNVPSLAIGDMFFMQTLKRSVKNVSGNTVTYAASVPAIEGLDITVTPSTLTLGPGDTGNYTVSFRKNDVNGKVTRNAAGAVTSRTNFLNAYASTAAANQVPSITWAGGGVSVRSPIAVRAQAVNTPTALSLKIENGAATATLPVKFGYNGGFFRAQGAAAAPVAFGPATVVDDEKDSFVTATPDAGKGFTTHELPTPAGLYLRIALVSSDDDPATEDRDDLDMYLYRVTKTTVTNVATGASTVTETKSLLASAATSAQLETINLTNPSLQPNAASSTASGIRTTTETKNVLYVHGFNTDGPDSTYTINQWTAVANPTASPVATAEGATTKDVTLTYPSLTAGTKYLSVVQWITQPYLAAGDAAGAEIGRTLVDIQ